jgi:hypothetical protein
MFPPFQASINAIDIGYHILIPLSRSAIHYLTKYGKWCCFLRSFRLFENLFNVCNLTLKQQQFIVLQKDMGVNSLKLIQIGSVYNTTLLINPRNGLNKFLQYIHI